MLALAPGNLVLSRVPQASLAEQKTILFDAAHAQTDGQRRLDSRRRFLRDSATLPHADQAGITSTTPETYWNGAHSAMGVDLVKKGFHVESPPRSARASAMATERTPRTSATTTSSSCPSRTSL